MWRRRHPSTRPGNRPRWLIGPALVALLALGVGSPAQAASDTEAPSVPGPATIAEITTTSITLTWTPSTDNVGVASYQVTQFVTDVAIGRSTPTNTITITGLRPSSTHRFTVRAVDAAGNSSLSSAMLVVTMPPGDSQPPTAPVAPQPYTVGDTVVVLTWGTSSDNVYVAAYEVLMVSAPGSPVVATAPQHPPTGPTARVTGLTAGTTYTFAVRARDDAGNVSALSTPLTVTTTGGTPPTPPTCRVGYRILGQWQGGFQAEVRIHNSGPADVTGWSLAWGFPASQQIQQVWNGTQVTDDTGTAVRDAGWNARIAVGGSVSFGFIGSWTGGNPTPAAFRLNGTSCATD